MKHILIIGATSSIAEATARLWAARGYCLFLAGRNTERLNIMKDDLSVRGASQVATATFDANNPEDSQSIINQAISELGHIDIALLAHGTLSDQQNCEADFTAASREIQTNALSYFDYLGRLANYFSERQTGSIAVISSVAGDRGRQSNYFYGAAKGSVTLYTQGLRQRLFKQGVHVLTIKPGFVDTPMTQEFKKGLLWAKPEKIANDIVNAIDKRKDVIYTPWFWRWIMLVIKSIPETVFKRLSL